jgi:hypothetical protein
MPILSTLCGYALTEIWHLGVWGFEFRKDDDSGPRLHVLCPWRLRDAERILMSSQETGPHGGLVSPSSEDIDAHARLDRLLDEGGLIVTNVECGAVGALTVHLPPFVLDILPCGVEDEHYRWIPGSGPHYVCAGSRAQITAE